MKPLKYVRTKMTEKEILEKFLSKQSAVFVYKEIKKHKFSLHFTKRRQSKLGDFKVSHNPKQLTITLNNDMHKDQSFFVFLHELAHLFVYKKYGNLRKPHGKRWITQYLILLESAYKKNYFSDDFAPLIINLIENNFTNTDRVAIRDYFMSKENIGKLLLCDIAMNQKFRLESGRKFIKLEKMRKNYKCTDLDNNKKYIVKWNTPVKILKYLYFLYPFLDIFV